jgi:2-polyprenyl-6-methoxyphenol hydroxylase-like FAD-dependent oxidoreductase
VPPEQRIDGDERYTVLVCRRPGFELALRRAVDEEPGIELLAPTQATGLLVKDGGALQACGVQLEDGTEVRGDFVFDCGGRRSPMSRWLKGLGIDVVMDTQECGLTYYARYFRQLDHSTLPRVTPRTGDLGYMSYFIMGGDNGTFCANLAAPPWDEDLKKIRDAAAWEAVAREIPDLAPYLEPSESMALTDVKVMAGLTNTRRQFCADGTPLVAGLLPLGDAVMTTNPLFAWGASIALTHACNAVDAVVLHGDDVIAATQAYFDATAVENEGAYRNSAATDRARIRRWRHEPTPEWDQIAAEQQELLSYVSNSMWNDPDLLRAFMGRAGLIHPPDAIFEDERVMSKARARREEMEGRWPTAVGPTRDLVVARLGQLSEGQRRDAHG